MRPVSPPVSDGRDLFRSSLSCINNIWFETCQRVGPPPTDNYLFTCVSLSLEIPGYFGLEAVVDGDTPPVVHLEANRIQTEVLSERSSADTDQQHVTRQRLVLPPGCRLHSATSNTSTTSVTDWCHTFLSVNISKVNSFRSVLLTPHRSSHRAFWWLP